MPSKPFDMQAAIAFAWAVCWADNLAKRAAGDDFRGNTYYLTASDIEVQVRRLAHETVQGKPWGSTGRAWGRGWEGGLRLPGNVQAQVRDWLLSNPELEGHNFGRGHISGMRFRPRGEPMAPGEQRTVSKPKKTWWEKPVHYARTYGPPKCVENRVSKFYNSMRRRSVRTESDWEHVTCPRCLKLR